MTMIVITGATGKLGGAVAKLLLERITATELGVSVRDPKRADALAERGVRVRRGDYDDAASLRHAFEGASKILMISSNSGGARIVEQHRTVIDAARAAGVRHVVYTSHMGANADSAFAPMRGHAATEALLHASGLAFTSLRNGFYADSALQIMGGALETGSIVRPADGPVSWTAHADLAEAAATALTGDGELSGITPPLTASAALDLADIAAIASNLTGREIGRSVISDDEYRAGALERGMPEASADMYLGLFVASRNGEFAAVDPALEKLLGRPPAPMRDVLQHWISNERSNP